MASMPYHAHRAAGHRQPRDRRIDFTTPGFTPPPDPTRDPLACCPHCEHPPGREETHVWPCSDCDPEAPDAA